MTEGPVHYGRGDETSVTLLERVSARDKAAWDRFVHLYAPLVYQWCRQFGLQEADARDVGQEVFAAVAESILSFRRSEGPASFRRWLRVITRNKLCDFARARAATPQAAGEFQALQEQLSQGDSSDDASEREDRLVVYRRAVELILSECEEKTRQAFWSVVVEGQAVKDVAEDLGLTTNSVYLLKSRLLRKLRAEFDGCVEM
jgi:RNA polymerase sigma-70 factor (ECF subfamily)